jgi:peptide/nickel transport system ATP-binding protein/oligopeptide transport system ATP-binding protein
VPSLQQDQPRLVAIRGTLPEPARRPPGCRFAPRCRYAEPRCREALPPLEQHGINHTAACIRISELMA